jgi:competence CoiA-like predicted nuclease
MPERINNTSEVGLSQHRTSSFKSGGNTTAWVLGQRATIMEPFVLNKPFAFRHT